MVGTRSLSSGAHSRDPLALPTLHFSTFSDHTRHAQKSTEADAAAAHRRTVQCVARKPRQESRDRDCAFEPRQRHPGALMRAGAAGEGPVRRAADAEPFGAAELI